MNEVIPLDVQQVEKVSQYGHGVHRSQGAQVPHQGDHIPNVEGGN